MGSAGASLLIALVGLSWAMGITGGALALAPLLLWRELRSVDAAASASPDVVKLVRTVPTLEPMTCIGLERLDRSVQEASLLDAEPAVTKGEVGDVFYVVVQGELIVCLDGRQRRKLGPGDAFGEIALLKAVPRTASVLSIGSSKLLSIDGNYFIAAVTGHRVAEKLAQDATDDLLEGDTRSSST